jgi:hypothetical protein
MHVDASKRIDRRQHQQSDSGESCEDDALHNAHLLWLPSGLDLLCHMCVSASRRPPLTAHFIAALGDLSLYIRAHNELKRLTGLGPHRKRRLYCRAIAKTLAA